MLAMSVMRRGAVLAAALVLVAAPAAAAVPDRGAAQPCAIEHFCLYSRGQQEGAMASYTKGTRDTALQNLPKGGWSAWNRTSEYWCLWTKPDYEGTKYGLNPGDKFDFTAIRSLLPSSDFRC
ncbi:peptidase inhibitor family I36 protein [Kitasatospora sp. NPDC051164]|uniref:peptidase inhibitor family I36 protein n=2 Tax=unclassified Kitasatospora TaxID=2633591 RepID=UPI0037893372